MIFRPDIKPPMWGPPDEVQYAVRVNAERLGIDSALIKQYCPLWENAGTVVNDYVSLNKGDVGSSLLWDGLGIGGNTAYTNSEGVVSFGSTLNFSQWAGLSVVYTGFFIFPSSNQAFPGLVTNMPSGDFFGGWNLSYERDYTKETLYFRAGNNSTGGTLDNLSGRSLKNRTVTVVATWDKSLSRVYFDGKQQFTVSATNGWGSPGPCNIGGYFRSTWRTSENTHHQCLIVADSVSSLIAESFTATPYALLMPVSRPVYFDLGAGGGTGAFTTPSLSTTPSVTAGTLSGTAATTGAFTAPSASTQPTVSAGSLAGVQAGIFNCPSVSTQPAISAGTLAGAQSATLNAPLVSVQPSVSVGTLAGVQVGGFLAPPVSAQPAVLTGTLAGVQAGTAQSPITSTQPAVSIGVLVGHQSGNFLSPALFVTPDVDAGTLQSLGNGLFSTSSASVQPTVAAATLAGASVGTSQAPSLSTAPTVSAGTLVGNQSGNFLGPSINLWPDVQAGTLSGVSVSSGAFAASALSVQTIVRAGILRGTQLFAPEVFAAVSAITTEYEAESKITNTFSGVSRLDIRRNV